VVGGPVIGGAVTQGLAWQWIFWLNVPIGLIAIPFILRHIDESYGARARLDIRGLALVTGGALGLVWGLVRGNTVGWGSLEIVGCARRRGRLPGRVRARRAPSRGADAADAAVPLTRICGGQPRHVHDVRRAVQRRLLMAQFLQTTLGQSPLGAGLRLIPWTGTVFIVAPIAGALSTRSASAP